MKNMKIYKLRKKSTGLFFSQTNINYWILGYGISKWNETGKVFNSPTFLLNLKRDWERNYEDNKKSLQELAECEIVEFELTETNVIEWN